MDGQDGLVWQVEAAKGWTEQPQLEWVDRGCTGSDAPPLSLLAHTPPCRTSNIHQHVRTSKNLKDPHPACEGQNISHFQGVEGDCVMSYP